MKHSTEDGIKLARSYGTTPASCEEIKPRNAKERLNSPFVFGSIVFLCSKRN